MLVLATIRYVNRNCDFLFQIPSFISILLSSLVEVTYSTFLKKAYWNLRHHDQLCERYKGSFEHFSQGAEIGIEIKDFHDQKDGYFWDPVEFFILTHKFNHIV